MAGTITHRWEGTTLIVTSDSGTSSCDLKGNTGDIGIRGPQGMPGIVVDDNYCRRGETYVKSEVDAALANQETNLKQYTDNAVAEIVTERGVSEEQLAAALVDYAKATEVNELKTTTTTHTTEINTLKAQVVPMETIATSIETAVAPVRNRVTENEKQIASMKSTYATKAYVDNAIANSPNIITVSGTIFDGVSFEIPVDDEEGWTTYETFHLPYTCEAIEKTLATEEYVQEYVQEQITELIENVIDGNCEVTQAEFDKLAEQVADDALYISKLLERIEALEAIVDKMGV